MAEKKKRQLPAEAIDQILKAGYTGPEDFGGPNGFLHQLLSAVVNRALNTELDHHLGYDKGQAPPEDQANRRNGHSSKTLRGDQGPVETLVPRDREGTFEPQLIKKHERSLAGFDGKILAMYARGMSTRDIQSHMQEVYGLEISPQLVSDVTEAVTEEVKAWQSRPLEPVYLVVYLDALVVKIRDKGVVANKSLPRRRPSARRLQGRPGHGDRGDRGCQVLALGALRTAPAGCPRHPGPVRRRTHRPARGRGGVVPESDLSDLHRPHGAQLDALRSLEGPQGRLREPAQHLHRSQRHRRPERTRRVRGPVGASLPHGRQVLAKPLERGLPVPRVPARDSQGDLHHQRDRGAEPPAEKVLKTKGALPSDEAASKLLFLALRNAKKTWGGRTRDWTPALAQFTVFFGDRFPQ